MNIIVCIKQVPDTRDVHMDPVTGTLIRDHMRAILNPFDKYAIETALQIKEQIGGHVTVLSMGPPAAKHSIEDALAMGVDNAILLSDPAFAGSDTLATSYILSQGIRTHGQYDLIICGKQALDGDTAQVGPGIASFLDIAQVTMVSHINQITRTSLRLTRLMDNEETRIDVSFPAVITVLKDIYLPRYPSFIGKHRAKQIPIKCWTQTDINCDAKQIGLNGSPTWVDQIFSPQVKRVSQPVIADNTSIQKAAILIVQTIEEMQ